MDCRGSSISAHLLMPWLDPDEIRRGHLLTVLAALPIVLLSRLLIHLPAIGLASRVPLGMPEVGRRAIGPFLEGLAKARRIGKADPFGDLVDAQMRIFEQFGRK